MQKGSHRPQRRFVIAGSQLSLQYRRPSHDPPAVGNLCDATRPLVPLLKYPMCVLYGTMNRNRRVLET